MKNFNKKINDLYEELFGESLTDELEKVKKKIQGMEDEAKEDGSYAVDELPDDLVEDAEEEGDEPDLEVDDEETDDDIEGAESDEIDDIEPDDIELDGDNEADEATTSGDGIDVSQIYAEVDTEFEDLSDNELEYEVHTARQQLFDFEDQFGPNSTEYMRCFIKTRVGYQKLNSDSVSSDSDIFYPLWEE